MAFMNADKMFASAFSECYMFLGPSPFPGPFLFQEGDEDQEGGKACEKMVIDDDSLIVDESLVDDSLEMFEAFEMNGVPTFGDWIQRHEVSPSPPFEFDEDVGQSAANVFPSAADVFPFAAFMTADERKFHLSATSAFSLKRVTEGYVGKEEGDCKRERV